jgi:hypothetical protein
MGKSANRIIFKKCDLNRAESVVEFESCVLDVDTVKEGSEIFILDDSRLLYSSTNLGNIFKIDSMNGKIVLFLLSLRDHYSFRSIDALVHLET